MRDHARVTWRQRRLIRHLRRSGHASVQDAAVYELDRSMRRSHGLHPPKAPHISGHGQWRPLTRRAKALLTRLKGARAWNVKKNLLAELVQELEHGRRLADRAREAARKAAARAERVMKAIARRGRQAGVWQKKAFARHLDMMERQIAGRVARPRTAPFMTRAARNAGRRFRSTRQRIAWPSRSRRRAVARPVPGQFRVPRRTAARTVRLRFHRASRTPRTGRPARTPARTRQS